MARGTRSPFRKLYHWCLHLAKTPHALLALFCISFIESSVFPIPPDVILVAMCFALPKKWIKFAFWCTLASVLGGMLGYLIGWGFYELIGRPIVEFYHGEKIMANLNQWYNEYGILGILIAAITPLPYKIFTIASGVFHFSLPAFIVASIVGRGFRFFLVAGLIGYFGESIRPFIERRFELVMTLFGILGILGFAVLVYLK